MLSTNQKESYQENKIDINVDEHGFLINPEEWTEAYAASVPGLLPSSLNSRHKDVLHSIRKKYLHHLIFHVYIQGADEAYSLVRE